MTSIIQVPVSQTEVKGWNPNPANLANQQEPIDPEKLKAQQELEEKKKKRYCFLVCKQVNV